MSTDMWFSGWMPLVRTVLVGIAAYAMLVVVLRTSGKRTLAKLNAFDLVVTVALGSTLASVLITTNVSFAQGATAFIVLAGLQYCVTWLSIRSARIRRLVRSEPTMLLYQGEVIDAALRAERLTRDEVLSALRSAGVSRFEDADAVVLETDGSIAVIARRTADARE